jgi:hypothetical protein
MQCSSKPVHAPSSRVRLAVTTSVQALLLSVVAVGCGGVTGTAPSSGASADPAVIRERATALITPFKKQLKQALGDAMKTSGPIGAIDVCEIEAPALAEAASTDGARVGRSAVKLRNPKNAPPEWAKPFLDELAASSREDGTFRTTILPDGRLGYVEAIHLQPMCETCHGKAVADDVVAALAAKYPNDQATGFATGDFRGVFWVELPADPPR